MDICNEGNNSHPDFLPEDLVQICDDGRARELMVIRQFDNGLVIAKIKSESGLVNGISITGVGLYAGRVFNTGASFRFPSLADLLRFAKRVDPKLEGDLMPLAAHGDDVQDTVLARAILRSFEDPNVMIMGKIDGWRSESRYLHQLGIKSDYYDNVINGRSDTYQPQPGVDVKFNVTATDGQLLGMEVIIDQLSQDGMRLIHSEIHVVDSHAAMAMQTAFGAKGIDIYNALVEAYAPFALDSIEALRSKLSDNHINYIFDSYERPVDPKTKCYRIDLDIAKGRGDKGAGNVEYGSDHYLEGEIRYVNTVIVGVKVEDVHTSYGYWHDNPNYPYSDVQKNQAAVTDPDQIVRLAQALGIDQPTPDSMLEAMKPKFTSLSKFVDYLMRHGIKYTT